ncbi:MAG TPA: hypothetical protein VIN73_12150 [Vicingaceae bacterium]
MKKIAKILLSVVLMNFILLTSCQKENIIDKEITESNLQKDKRLSDGSHSLNSDLTEENNFFNLNTREVVWAIGANNRVFKSIDNGVSWTEPNPAARLQQISCGKLGGVWGVSYGRVYKWNGSYWEEPVPSITNAKEVCVVNDNIVWLVRTSGRVFKTTNGGADGFSYEALCVNSINEIAADFSATYGLISNKEIYRYNGLTDYFEDYFNHLNKARHIAIGGSGNKYWAIGEYYNIYYSSDAVNWYEPNTSAYGYEITRGNTYTFVIGNSQRIFRSTDGVTWAEPNPAAGAFKISAGIEFY